MSKATVSIDEVAKFGLLFHGNEDAYGQYIPPKKKPGEGEKQQGSCFTEKKKRFTSELYRQHLEGRQGLGIVPINKDNNVRFCVIDIDVYPLDITKYQRAINEFELPFHIFKSKSGGAHLYLFFREDVKAEKIVPLMQRWVSVFGLPANTEIFPKQKRLSSSAQGNWINLPYFGTERRMINADCKEVSLPEALVRINQNITTFEEVRLAYDELKINDGPPCLQSIYAMNDPSMYEMYLFNLAVYLKGKAPNTWQEYVYKANERLENGLDQERIEKQIIQQHERKTYSYRCSEEPICSRCDRGECEGRKFGKGGDEISDFTFEDMTQVLSDPPHYKWIVNGTTMTFFSEQELRDQNKFADYCMRNLHKVPNKLKNGKWVNVLNKAFTDIKQEKVELKDDLSPGAVLAEYVFEFLFERHRAKTKQQVAQLGRVWEDEDKEMLYFRKNELLKFLTGKNILKLFGITEIQARLKDYGSRASSIYIDKKHGSLRVWGISITAAKNLGDSQYDSEAEIDFEDLIEDKEEF